MSGLQQRLANGQYANWLKAGLCLIALKEGLAIFAESVIQAFHSDILASLPGPAAGPAPNCGSCTNADIQYDGRSRRYIIRCPNSVCDKIIDRLQAEHVTFTKKWAWDNTEVRLWGSRPWELAKVYMSPGQDAANTSANHSDCSGLVNLVIHCKKFHRFITTANVYYQIRQHRNDVMHSTTMELTDVKLTEIIQDVLAALKDPKFLGSQPECKAAVKRVEEIRDCVLELTSHGEMQVLRDALKTLQSDQRAAQQQLQQLITASSTAEQDITSLQETSAQHATALTSLDTAEQDIISLQQTSAQHATALTSLDTAEQDIISLQETSAQHATTLTSLDTGLKKIKTQYGMLLTLFGKIGKEFISLTEECRELQTTIEKAMSDLKSLEARLQDAERRLAVVEVSVTENKRETAKVQIEVDALQKDNVNVKASFEMEKQRTRQEFSLRDQRLQSVEQLVTVPTRDVAKELEVLKKTLVDVYEEWVSTIPISPLGRENVRLKLEHLYIPVVLKSDPSVQSEQDDGEYCDNFEDGKLSYEGVFFDKTGRKNKNIFIQGKAGFGKSTWCAKFIQTWIKLKTGRTVDHAEENVKVLDEFDYVFFIPLRMSTHCDSIVDMIIECLPRECSDLKDTIEYVLKSCPEKCLVVFDGLDEWSCTSARLASPFHTQRLPGRGDFNGCVKLYTSRPWKLKETDISKGEGDTVLEIRGLNMRMRQGLVSVLLRNQFGISDFEVHERCFRDIEDQKQLAGIAGIPLLCGFLVIMWKENDGKLEDSVSSIVAETVNTMLKRTATVRAIQMVVASDYGHTSLSLPRVFDSKPVCQKNKSLILLLSKMAFEGLVSTSGQKLVFSEDGLRGKYSEGEMDLLKLALESGLLSNTGVPGRILDPESKFSFLHLIVQEFFAAVWIAVSEKGLDELCTVCTTFKDIAEMPNVLTFVVGLASRSITSRLSRHVAFIPPIIAECINSDIYLDNNQRHQVQSILIDCAIESLQCHRDISGVNLVSVCCEVYQGCRDTDVLKRLVDANCDQIRYACICGLGEHVHEQLCEFLVTRISNFKSLQALIMSNIATPSVLTVWPSLKIIHLCDVDVRFDLMESVPGDLTSIMLKDVTMRHDDMDNLLYVIRNSSSLQAVSYDRPVCRDCGQSCLKPFQFPLSCHTVLQKIVLKGLRLASLELPSVNLVRLVLHDVSLCHLVMDNVFKAVRSSKMLDELEVTVKTCSDCDSACTYPVCVDISEVSSLQKLFLGGICITEIYLPDSVSVVRLANVRMTQAAVLEFNRLTERVRTLMLTNIACPENPCSLILDLTHCHNVQELNLSGIPLTGIHLNVQALQKIRVSLDATVTGMLLQQLARTTAITRLVISGPLKPADIDTLSRVVSQQQRLERLGLLHISFGENQSIALSQLDDEYCSCDVVLEDVSMETAAWLTFLESAHTCDSRWYNICLVDVKNNKEVRDYINRNFTLKEQFGSPKEGCWSVRFAKVMIPDFEWFQDE